MEADNSKAGAKLVQRLRGPVGSYYIDVLPDSADGCGLYQIAGAERRQQQDPGRMTRTGDKRTAADARCRAADEARADRCCQQGFLVEAREPR
jgi:hypothetical protein